MYLYLYLYRISEVIVDLRCPRIDEVESLSRSVAQSLRRMGILTRSVAGLLAPKNLLETLYKYIKALFVDNKNLLPVQRLYNSTRDVVYLSGRSLREKNQTLFLRVPRSLSPSDALTGFSTKVRAVLTQTSFESLSDTTLFTTLLTGRKL